MKGAIVLCGGKSSRMGQDKATLPFGPEQMLQRIVRLISQVVDSSGIVVVAADGQRLPELPATITVTRDECPGRGPLEGIAAGLKAMPSSIDAVYATSCDVPLLKPQFVNRMFEHLGSSQIAVPFDGQYHHPLASVYRTSILPIVNGLLESQELRPRALFARVETVLVAVDSLREVDPSLSTLMNLNSPQDYEAALKLLAVGE
jgi:molybdopterin-guanine dinucleotide biosynthesis protein A